MGRKVVATLELEGKTQTLHWRAELSETEMVWVDLLFEGRFSHELRQLNQYVVDYRANLRNHIGKCLHQSRVYLMCAREKVRFDVRRRPKYHFFSKKMTFRLLLGKARRPVSISVKMADHFFAGTPKPEVLLDPKFITLINKDGEDLTLSIHDFLFSVGAELNLDSQVVATGCSPSPYWQYAAAPIDVFTSEAHCFIQEDYDLLVYLGDYLLQSGVCKPASVLERNFFTPDEQTPAMLMLSRCYALYFLFQQGTFGSVVYKNAGSNLLRFMQRRQITKITLSHVYDFNSEYMRLGSQCVDVAAAHEFEITLQSGTLAVDGEVVYPNLG